MQVRRKTKVLCFMRDCPQWARVSSFTRFLDHTQRRTTVSRTPWTRDQLVAETSTCQHTQYSQQTNVHARRGIRTHNLSRQAAADLRLRPRGHWDRLNRVTAPLIPNIIHRWNCVVKAKLQPGKEPRHPYTGDRICLGACPDGYGI